CRSSARARHTPSSWSIARCRDASRGTRCGRRAPSPGARTAWEWCRNPRLRSSSSSSPGLPLLPAPLAARTLLLDAEIELLDVLFFHQSRARVGHDDAADFEHVAVVADLQRHVGVLLDQQD